MFGLLLYMMIVYLLTLKRTVKDMEKRKNYVSKIDMGIDINYKIECKN